MSLQVQDMASPPYLALNGPQVLWFAGLEIAEPPIPATSLQPLSDPIGRRLEGLIGVELFYRYVVEIDYGASELRIFAPETYDYTGSGESLPVTYGHGLPIVAGTVTPCFACQELPVEFQADTGLAQTHAAFWSKFIGEHDLLANAWDVQKNHATGLDDTAPSKRGRLPRVRVGSVEVLAPLTGFMEAPHGDPNVFGGDFDATLGGAFFERFKVIFDLPHGRIVLEPASPRDVAQQLETALQFLRDQFAAASPVRFTAYARNNRSGAIASRDELVEFSNVRAGGPGCRLEYHERWMAGQEVVADADFGFALPDVQAVSLLSLAEALAGANARNGRAELGWRVVPQAFVVKAFRREGEDDLPLPNEESAKRMAGAVWHAAS